MKNFYEVNYDAYDGQFQLYYTQFFENGESEASLLKKSANYNIIMREMCQHTALTTGRGVIVWEHQINW